MSDEAPGGLNSCLSSLKSHCPRRELSQDEPDTRAKFGLNECVVPEGCRILSLRVQGHRLAKGPTHLQNKAPVSVWYKQRDPAAFALPLSLWLLPQPQETFCLLFPSEIVAYIDKETKLFFFQGKGNHYTYLCE